MASSTTATATDALPNVRVGVGVIVKNAAGKLLLGRRIGSHGAGTWAFPGGHLEHGEEIVDCAARELAEETGLAVTEPKMVAVSNAVFVQERKHYITLYVRGTLADEGMEPQVLEPDKCERWVWMTGDEIRALRESPTDKLFLTTISLLKEHERIEDL